jgi:hypothetical protein
MDAVLKRLSTFIKFLGMNNYSFELAAGLSKNVIQKPMLSGTSFTLPTLLKIAETFPELNLNWLLSGTGDMLQKNELTERNTLLPKYKSIAELEQKFVELQGSLIVCMQENIELRKPLVTRSKKRNSS